MAIYPVSKDVRPHRGEQARDNQSNANSDASGSRLPSTAFLSNVAASMENVIPLPP
jgi:hypothetical protein